eukprot:364191-Chlamydomonas_euryale.AAC.6
MGLVAGLQKSALCACSHSISNQQRGKDQRQTGKTQGQEAKTQGQEAKHAAHLVALHTSNPKPQAPNHPA